MSQVRCATSSVRHRHSPSCLSLMWDTRYVTCVMLGHTHTTGRSALSAASTGSMHFHGSIMSSTAAPSRRAPHHQNAARMSPLSRAPHSSSFRQYQSASRASERARQNARRGLYAHKHPSMFFWSVYVRELREETVVEAQPCGLDTSRCLSQAADSSALSLASSG